MHYSLHAIRTCDVPVIGAVNGHAMGMGMGLALATDIRIAWEAARFQVSQTSRGTMPDFGLGHFLPQQIGSQRALELMFTARMIDAQRAAELGLVIDVVRGRRASCRPRRGTAGLRSGHRRRRKGRA